MPPINCRTPLSTPLGKRQQFYRKAAANTAWRESQSDPESQLQRFIEKFEPEHQQLIRACRKAVQRRFSTANELVYDNYNFFVIGYSPTERLSDTIVSLAAGANGGGLPFPYCGTRLPDPTSSCLARAARIGLFAWNRPWFQLILRLKHYSRCGQAGEGAPAG